MKPPMRGVPLLLLAVLVLLAASPAQGYVRLVAYNNLWQYGTTVSGYLATVVEFDNWCWYASTYDCLEWYIASVYGVMQRDGATVTQGYDDQSYNYPAGVYLYDEIPPGGGNFYDLSGYHQAMWHGDFSDDGADYQSWTFIYVQPTPLPPPSIYDMSPSVAERGSSGYLTISGQYLSYATNVNVSGTGVSMYVSAVLSDNQIEAGYSVDSGAAPGPRTVTVTTSSGTSNGLTFNVTAPATVNITYASIPDDRITVELAPAGLSGTLTVQVVGATTHTVYQGTKSAGTHDISFNIPNLPTGEFTQVRATWAVDGAPEGTTYYHFKVLGEYLNTRYNTPTESYCSGSQVDISYVTGDCTIVGNCNFTTYQGKSGWWDEVWENGSGLSQNPTIGVVSREWYCSGPARRTRRVPTPCPQCVGMPLVEGQTVARNLSNSELPCGAALYVHGVGTVTVTDAGDLALNQLDHYDGFGGCNRTAGTIGNRKVIRLF